MDMGKSRFSDETGTRPGGSLLAHIHYQTDLFPDFVSFGFLERLKK